MNTEAPPLSPLRRPSPATLQWLGAVTAACLAAGFIAHFAAPRDSGPAQGPTAAPSAPLLVPTTPVVGRFVFGVTPALPQATPELLPAEAAVVFAFTAWPAGMRRDDVEGRWSWQAGPMVKAPVAPVRAPGGQILARLELSKSPTGPLGPGLGEVELRARGHRAAYGCFVLAAQAGRILAQQAPPTAQTQVTNLVTGRSLGPDGRVAAPEARFQPTDRVFISFAYTGADPGADFVVHWYAQGNELQKAHKSLPVAGAEGTGSAWIQAHDKGLPPGTYRVAVCYGADTVPLAQAQWQVVPGPALPAAKPSSATKAAPAGAGAPPHSRK